MSTAVHPGSILPAGAATVAAATGLTSLVDGIASWWAPGAAGLSAGVLLVGAAVSRGAGRLAPVAMIGLWVAGLPLMVGAVSTVHGWSLPSGWLWFGNAWRDLAAGPAPATVSAAPVLALAVTGWIAGGLAALAACAGRGSLLALTPSVGLLVVVGLTTEPDVWFAPVVVVSIGLYLAHRRPPDVRVAPEAGERTRRYTAWIRRTPTAAILGCGAAVALLASGLLPAPTPAARVPAEAETPSSSTPLVWVSAWQIEPARTVFHASAGTAPLRWATLQRYDGSTWRADGTFTLTGPTIRVADLPSSTGRDVSSEISDVALPGRWLPSPGLPVRVDGGPVMLDDGTGDLLATPAGPPGSYAVQAVVPDVDEAALRAADQQPRVARQVHGDDPTSPVFGQRAHAATAGAASDYDRLAALAQWCRDSVHHDPNAVPGQSIRVLEEVAAGTRPATADQIVGAYALMARALGYPTRVVVGFAPQDAGDVLSTDIVAWPEVYLDGVGWQPFYPVALPGVEAEVEIVRHAVDRGPTVLPAEPSPERSPDRSPVASAERQVDQPEAPGWLGTAIAWVGGLLLLAGLLIAGLRLRAHRAGTPAERLVRQWKELQRSLSRSMGSRVRAMTGEELVDAVAATGGPEAAAAARAVSDAVTLVVYGGGVVDEGDVAAARRRVKLVRVAVRRGVRTSGAATRGIRKSEAATRGSRKSDAATRGDRKRTKGPVGR